MTLKNCKECGKEISNKADVCPHCGAKNRRSGGCALWGALGAVLLLMIGYCNYRGEHPNEKSATEQRAQSAHDAEEQKRKDAEQNSQAAAEQKQRDDDAVALATPGFRSEMDDVGHDTNPSEAGDEAQAKAWGISVATFKYAREQEGRAYVACVEAVKTSAQYEYKSDWLPNAEWKTDGNSITIVGHDIKLQNGFGAYSNGSYMCQWDMKTKTITSVSAN